MAPKEADTTPFRTHMKLLAAAAALLWSNISAHYFSEACASSQLPLKLYVHTCNNTMGLTKQQRSNRYYRRKVERALYYLDLAAEFECLSITPTQSSAAPAPIRTTKPKARRLGKCFGKVSRSTDLEGVILMLLSSLYLSDLTYVPILSTHSFQIVNVIQIPTCVSIVYDAIG
eukprot:15327527-Ditylum_brightwellii.AAC.1